VSYEPNPPWVDKIVAKNWASLESMVGPERMPTQTEGSTPRRRHVQDYGCGHYGCVSPTKAPEIVFKVTSDPLEAHFVASALLIASKDKSFGWPVGIVRYENIVQLDGSYRSRPVFGLWREEAYDVGALVHAHRHQVGGGPEWFRKLDAYGKMAFEQFAVRLVRFKDWAGRFKMSTDRSANRAKLLEDVRRHERWARDAIELEEAENGYERVVKSHWSAPQKLASCLRACEINAELMANEPVGTEVGEALDFYMERGLLLADVHLNNIGRLLREDYSSGVWGITDPGHAVPLDDRFAAVLIPSLAAA
jgi:hypothetical protein